MKKSKNYIKYESDTVDKTKEHPNVIVVINEAFSDLKDLGDFETNEDICRLSMD